LAVSPGVRIRLVPLDTVLPAMQKRWGNLYFRAIIQKEYYLGLPADSPTVGVANLLISHQDFSADLAYQITKLLFERRPELALVHKEASNITLTGAAGRSPLPFHPGATKYFMERNVEGF
jgi:TRAP transporter TAXI family solute receptor